MLILFEFHTRTFAAFADQICLTSWSAVDIVVLLKSRGKEKLPGESIRVDGDFSFACGVPGTVLFCEAGELVGLSASVRLGDEAGLGLLSSPSASKGFDGKGFDEGPGIPDPLPLMSMLLVLSARESCLPLRISNCSLLETASSSGIVQLCNSRAWCLLVALTIAAIGWMRRALEA